MPFKSFTNYLSENTERLFLFAPVLFGTGIGVYFSYPTEPMWPHIILPIFFLFFAFFLCRHSQGLYLFLTACLVFMLGMASAKFETQRALKNIEPVKENTVTYLKGIVKQIDFNAKSKPRLLLKNVSDEDKPLKGFYRLTTTDKTTYQVGDCVETAAVISPPFFPLKPNTHQFNRHAFFEGISATGYTLTPFYKIECSENHSFRAKLDSFFIKLRQNITTQISKTLSTNEAAIASALLTGNKNLISKSLYSQYRISGLAHFLAISGLHIGLIAAFFFIFTRFLLSTIPYVALKFSTHKIAAFLTIFFTFVYLLLSGASLSAERAFIMAAVVFFGLIVDRAAISMRTVAIAALIILAFEPHALLSAGFQMSFAAATALIAFYENYHLKNAHHTSNLLTYFISVLLTSLIATLATMPYTVYHFTSFSPYAVFSNILAAPIIGFIIMPFIFIALLVYPLHLSFYPLQIADFGLRFLNELTKHISHLQSADFHIVPLPMSGLILITFGGLLLCLLNKKERFFGFVFIFFGLTSYAFLQTPDIFYTSDGKTIALATENKSELIIFSKKKNDFTTEILSQGFKRVQIFKHLQSIPSENLFCSEDKCTFKNIFTFDLNGNLFLNNNKLDLKADLGGTVFLKSSAPKVQSVRKQIGFRPWNTPLRPNN